MSCWQTTVFILATASPQKGSLSRRDPQPPQIGRPVLRGGMGALSSASERKRVRLLLAF